MRRRPSPSRTTAFRDWPGECRTPAFVYDEPTLLANVRAVREIADSASCRPLYSLKACCLHDVLELIASGVHGFSCSSLFEALSAREITRIGQSVHYVSPGLLAEDRSRLFDACDFVTLNTIEQAAEVRTSAGPSIGLRVNPELSFVTDRRYDPCSSFSRLGVLLSELSSVARRPPGISGLHVHSNCDSTNWTQLRLTVEQLVSEGPEWLEQLHWVNLGGGYLLHPGAAQELLRASRLLREIGPSEIFLEPGAAIVRDAAFLVTRVLDVLNRADRRIAIVDSTINHAPEVFEYQFSPEILGADEEFPHEYIVAGRSCLAGDVFGIYSFEKPLDRGAVLVFESMGAYTTTKWHNFNGINLPTIYALTESGELQLRREFTYSDFANRNGVPTSVDI